MMPDEDDWEAEADFEIAEARRGNQPGRVNDDVRKAARIRARVAAEKAAAEARSHGALVVIMPGPSGAQVWQTRRPSWLSKLFQRILRWIRA